MSPYFSSDLARLKWLSFMQSQQTHGSRQSNLPNLHGMDAGQASSSISDGDSLAGESGLDLNPHEFPCRDG